MKVTCIEDLRDSLPFSQDGATDEEMETVRGCVHDLCALEDAVRAIFGVCYLRFERNYISVENDYSYPIFRIYATGIMEECAGNIIKLKK